MQRLTDYRLPALLLGILSCLVYWGLRKLQQSAAARNNGCLAPPVRQGATSVKEAAAAKTFTTLSHSAKLFDQIGRTFKEPSLLGPLTLKTIDPENIQTIFSTRSKQWGVQPFRLVGMRPFCGEGVLTTDGNKWEQSRSILRPSFHRDKIQDLAAFEVSLSQLIERIPVDGTEIDIAPLLSLMFVDTTSCFLLGESMGVLSGNANHHAPVPGPIFFKSLMLSLRSVGMRNQIGLLRLFLPRSQTTDQWAVIHKQIDFFIDQGLAARKQGETVSDPHGSLLASLLDQTEDRTFIRNHLIQGIMAAQDTTPTLISNTIFQLARRPDLWSRLRAEVNTELPSPVRADDTKKLLLCRKVLNETLRLYPVFPTLARVALTDTILPSGGGPDGRSPIYAPAGTRVLAHFYALHRDPDVWGSNPETFDPDRWDHISPSPWQFMGFGGGQRACLGQVKALAEATTALVRLAEQFERLEGRGDDSVKLDQKMVAKNINGCKVAFFKT